MPTNSQRAADADLACEVFAEAAGLDEEDMPSVITDLITNLLHLANQEGACAESILRVAKMHYQAEIEEEEEADADD
jgi:hypothetical protein